MSSCRRAAIAAAAEMLAAEAAEHSDLVVVRGADAYRNLPNKTVRLLRYMLSSARGCARSRARVAILTKGCRVWGCLL